MVMYLARSVAVIFMPPVGEKTGVLYIQTDDGAFTNTTNHFSGPLAVAKLAETNLATSKNCLGLAFPIAVSVPAWEARGGGLLSSPCPGLSKTYPVQGATLKWDTAPDRTGHLPPHYSNNQINDLCSHDFSGQD